MPGIDYKKILDEECGIGPQQQGQLERPIAEYLGLSEQRQQQQQQGSGLEQIADQNSNGLPDGGRVMVNLDQRSYQQQ